LKRRSYLSTTHHDTRPPMKGYFAMSNAEIDRQRRLTMSQHDAGDRAAGGRSPLYQNRELNKWMTLTAVCLGTFMLLLDVTIVNVALPSIQTSLHASFSDLQWVVDAYALTLAAFLLTAGAFADMYGRKLVYVAGLLIFTVASMLCGFATDPLFLELSRAAQGVGGAIMFSVSLALLADAFRGRDRGVAFGIWGAITGIAVAVGPLLGGALTSGLSWRWIFLVNLPIGVVALLITVLRVSESRAPQARRPDWIGVAAFTSALALLIYGLIESGERGFTDDRVLGCFVASGLLLVTFIAAERFGKHPMFDLALFRLPTFSGGLIAAFGLSASIFAMFLYLVLYIQDTLGYSAFQTGLRLLIVSGGILLTSTAAGRLTEHVSVRWLIGPGLLIVGIGLLLMRGLTAASSWTHLVAGFIVAGIGIGMINPPLASTAVGVVEPHRAGMASGINSTFRQIGIATGIALLGTLFANRERSQIVSRLAVIPGAHSHTGAIIAGLRSGQIAHVLPTLPASLRGSVGIAARGAFTNSLNLILLVSAVIALVCGVIALVTIRPKDFRERPAS
jgi:EmrB/QacA subfamily drug resistance transporter